VQIKVCSESANAVAEPSSRPVRGSASETNGMMTTLRAVSTMPTVLCSASTMPVRARNELADTESCHAAAAAAIPAGQRRQDVARARACSVIASPSRTSETSPL
jgi:hypothetical protein